MSEEELGMSEEADANADTDFDLDDDGILDFGDDDLDEEENLGALGFSLDEPKDSEE